MTLEVRPARSADVPRLVEISRITQAEHAARLPDMFSGKDDPVCARTYPDILAGRTPGAVVVAHDGARILGHAGAAIVPVEAPEQRHHRTGLILDVSVDRDARGTGVGRLLLDALADAMRGMGATDLRAQVWTGNAASESLFTAANFAPMHREFRLSLAPSLEGPARRDTLNPAYWLLIAVGALGLGLFLAMR
ncbi:GNAT family N-acetyltransferase [Silicimonas algicola]|uniref:Ribosomal protein S18 acetylase RimI-like enzyme n=1 Tax=Silicimonas algicola TaxID=1826607 RepID=A0A316G492_9RHOB|nr:GNAT family N-acetyltransferase [Silicimonas algicola]AZQ68575.1 GNAT family N-acetyltransferase [Silicimonas algicola]PWK55709.1 ribosomal protein S18 acetylase RimI-like enzyme [Silicimonas algicola]